MSSKKLREFIKEVGRSDMFARHVTITTDAAVAARAFINNRLEAAAKGGKTSKRRKKSLPEPQKIPHFQEN